MIAAIYDIGRKRGLRVWWNIVGLLIGLVGAFLLGRDGYFWTKSAPINVIPNLQAMTVWGRGVPRWLYNIRHGIYFALIAVGVLFQIIGELQR